MVATDSVAETTRRWKSEEPITSKYAGFGMEAEALGGKHVPDATTQHYAGRAAVLRLTPFGRLVTWENSRLRLS